MDKVFLDADVILDLILQREPFFTESARLFALIEKNEIEGYASPLIFSNLFYILRKIESNKFAINVLLRLKALLNIAKIDEKTIELALSSGFRDFEDAVQNYAAIEAGVQFLITRNKSDYKGSSLIICTAKEFLSMAK
jgi:predicted nucleic acid-binding protein